MKPAKFLIITLLGVSLASCKKEIKPVTVPVEFKETTYQSLGTFDGTGKPNYLVIKDVISSEMLDFVSQTFTNSQDLRTTNPELFNNTAIGDIKITQQSDVFITFVYQNTYHTNTIGFYTYPTNTPPASAKDIQTISYIFPSAGSDTPLEPGDKVKIGRFNEGTSIGFVLLQSGWRPQTKTLDNKAVHFCSNDVLNPEVDPSLKKHAVLVNYTPENKVLIGFEDLDRTSAVCDHDFNDVIIYATVTP